MYKDGSPEASKSIVAKIPIIHVHGRIPNPGKALTRDWLVEAVKNIRLIRDGVEKLEETVLDKVSLALQQAHVVAFLGFGFSRENIHRLGIPFSLETTQYRKHGPDVYASAFDVTPSDRIWISKKVPFVQFGEADEDCFAVLRRFPVFRD
jgi:hypothetical protein